MTAQVGSPIMNEPSADRDAEALGDPHEPEEHRDRSEDETRPVAR